MQIVIDIPKKWLNDMKKEEFINVDELCEIILHGTKIPKGHGRLIDLNDLYDFDRRKVEYAQTIIEADKE